MHRKKNYGFEIIKLLRELIDITLNNFSAEKLFTEPPIIKIRPKINQCPSCHNALKVLKTEPNRKIITLHIGEVIIHQTYLHCDRCKNTKIYKSDELPVLVPQYGNFGFDIIDYAGQSVFRKHRTESEVVEELARRNVKISTSEVGYLSKKFIVYLAIIHRESVGEIENYMNLNGGYILHLDGMCEGKSPHLISALDELSSFVLANLKVPSENAGQIVPLLKEVKKKFGLPIAILTDMGRAMLGAVAEVFPGIKNFICHFHFLRDIGKDLLEKQYSIIRNTLKKYGITTQLRYRLRYYAKNNTEITDFNQITKMIQSKQLPETMSTELLKAVCYLLILWALEGKEQGNGFGFPFDRPHVEFYRRLSTLYDSVTTLHSKYLESKANIKNHSYKSSKEVNTETHLGKVLQKLQSDLQPLINDTECKEAINVFEGKVVVFDKLREAMRIALPSSKKGLNDNGEEISIKTIESNVKDFRNWLTNNVIYKNNTDYQKLIKQINKYWEMLFADPITVETPNGKITIEPQRTNNILERFFRDLRKDYRRTNGNNSMTKKLQTILADTPLVKNLDNQEYMKLLLKDKKTLRERFSEIEHRIVQEELKKAMQIDEKIPQQIKKIIKSENVPDLFLILCKN